jgi:hypothetical protein
MAVITGEKGIELPVCSPEKKLVTPTPAIASSKVDKFVRPIKMEIPGRWEPAGLGEVVKKTDEELASWP